MEKELYFCYLFKNNEFIKVLPEPFLDKGEANLYAKMYLTIRARKSLTIQIVPVRLELPVVCKS